MPWLLRFAIGSLLIFLIGAAIIVWACVSAGWETLYRDPRDGRLWELTYPQSEMHGGGPRRLHVLSRDEAAAKYEHAAI